MPDAYRAACSTLGRLVQVHLPGGQVCTGRALAVDDDGRLVVAPAGQITDAQAPGAQAPDAQALPLTPPGSVVPDPEVAAPAGPAPPLLVVSAGDVVHLRPAGEGGW